MYKPLIIDKIAKSYNDTCIENEQCMPLLGDKATCIDDKCACDESLHFKNGNCHEKKGISYNLKI